MTAHRRGVTMREFPSDLEIVTTRSFHAPASLVFAALTTPEHLRRWWATGGDTMTICEVDLRPGGAFHHVFVTPDGKECSFRGSYVEIAPPSRLVNTWLFEGWPNAWATETHEIRESDGVTTLTLTVAFRDAEGRAHMTRALASANGDGDNGQDASLDALEDVLRSLVEEDATND